MGREGRERREDRVKGREGHYLAAAAHHVQ